MTNVDLNPEISLLLQMDSTIRKLWFLGGYQSPQIPLLVKESQIFVVIDDSTSICRLLDRYGTLLAVSKLSCSPNPQYSYYLCNSPLFILNSKYSERDQFAMDSILPIVFTGGNFGF